ncbi:hypothetical protein NP233_g7237 [Leucocoprinus birnbaumii]|uniref:Nephrocystin 3-like N-terminal domain-containing protein n=1 Tax=Leucocoprinus birnbaumii TaxID=56174 RepID=A0AAD5VPM6_9AGAR|nr:hypothetical protein NP233_g7237 [Leucocoprinus birnbaumii]
MAFCSESDSTAVLQLESTGPFDFLDFKLYDGGTSSLPATSTPLLPQIVEEDDDFAKALGAGTPIHVIEYYHRVTGEVILYPNGPPIPTEHSMDDGFSPASDRHYDKAKRRAQSHLASWKFRDSGSLVDDFDDTSSWGCAGPDEYDKELGKWRRRNSDRDCELWPYASPSGEIDLLARQVTPFSAMLGPTDCTELQTPERHRREDNRLSLSTLCASPVSLKLAHVVEDDNSIWSDEVFTHQEALRSISGFTLPPPAYSSHAEFVQFGDIVETRLRKPGNQSSCGLQPSFWPGSCTLGEVTAEGGAGVEEVLNEPVESDLVTAVSISAPAVDNDRETLSEALGPSIVHSMRDGPSYDTTVIISTDLVPGNSGMPRNHKVEALDKREESQVKSQEFQSLPQPSSTQNLSTALKVNPRPLPIPPMVISLDLSPEEETVNTSPEPEEDPSKPSHTYPHTSTTVAQQEVIPSQHVESLKARTEEIEPRSSSSNIEATGPPVRAFGGNSPKVKKRGKRRRRQRNGPLMNQAGSPSLKLTSPDNKSSFFSNAHHNVLNNVKMVENCVHQYITLDKSSQKFVCGAELDSSARGILPRCHPGTRNRLIRKLAAWLENTERDYNVVSLTGPAGVGKSSVSQSFAEHARTRKRFGAAFFFARSSDCTDHLRVVPTLVRQLAVHDRDYRTIIVKLLLDDPTILEMNMASQFEQLIMNPFSFLVQQQPERLSAPILIVLDGLEACNNEDAQIELLDLICRSQGLSLPLLWFISFRRESHLTRALKRPDIKKFCASEEISVEDIDGQRDIYSYLQARFQALRERYPESFDLEDTEQWPSGSQLRQLAHMSSGLFVHAARLVDGFHAKGKRNPQEQLRELVGSMREPGSQLETLTILDDIYKEVLAEVDLSVLPLTKRILSLLVFFPGQTTQRSLTPQDIVNFLGISRGQFYDALDKLHSIIYIPATERADCERLRFYHPSIKDFLEDSRRSGMFSIDIEGLKETFAIQCLRWMNYDIQSHCNCQASCDLKAGLPQLKWNISKKADQTSTGQLSVSMRGFVRDWVWKACVEAIEHCESSQVVEELKWFNFCHLQQSDVSGNEKRFRELLVKTLGVDGMRCLDLCDTSRSGALFPMIDHDFGLEFQGAQLKNIEIKSP